MMLEELLLPQFLESLLRDGYGNYVVQTAVSLSEYTCLIESPFVLHIDYSDAVTSRLSLVYNLCSHRSTYALIGCD